MKNQFVSKVVIAVVATLIMLFAATSVRVMATPHHHEPMVEGQPTNVSVLARVQAFVAPPSVGLISNADLYCCCYFPPIVNGGWWHSGDNWHGHLFNNIWGWRWTSNYYPYISSNGSSMIWRLPISLILQAMPLSSLYPELPFPYAMINPWEPHLRFTGYLRDMVSGEYFHYTTDFSINFDVQPLLLGLVWEDMPLPYPPHEVIIVRDASLGLCCCNEWSWHEYTTHVFEVEHGDYWQFPYELLNTRIGFQGIMIDMESGGHYSVNSALVIEESRVFGPMTVQTYFDFNFNGGYVRSQTPWGYTYYCCCWQRSISVYYPHDKPIGECTIFKPYLYVLEPQKHGNTLLGWLETATGRFFSPAEILEQYAYDFPWEANGMIREFTAVWEPVLHEVIIASHTSLCLHCCIKLSWYDYVTHIFEVEHGDYWQFPYESLNRRIGFQGIMMDIESRSDYCVSSVLVIEESRIFAPHIWQTSFTFDFNGGLVSRHSPWGSSYYTFRYISINVYYPHDKPIGECTMFKPYLYALEPQKYGFPLIGWLETATGRFFSPAELLKQYAYDFPWEANSMSREFTAVWEPESLVNLTFNANEGTPETQTGIRGAGLPVGTLPPPPTREGFVFAGWFNTPAATGGAQLTATSTVPNTDTTYWARWHVVLTFNGNGGTPATQTLTRPPGSVINWNSLPPATPPGPIRPGYVFAGWYTTPSGTDGTRLTGMTIVPNTPTTYWARWKILTIYYENLVSVNTQAALNHADDSVNAIEHLFLTNFGVNLVQRNPASYEPGLHPFISASEMLHVSPSTHNTLRFRFAHFGIGVAGLARQGFGWNGHTMFHLGDMIVTTTLDPVSLRFTVVHEISHVLGAHECETGAGSGCVMSAATPRANYSHWCDLCRTRMHSYLGRLWIGHLSHFAPSGASQEFQPFADDIPYDAIFTEAVYFYTPY